MAFTYPVELWGRCRGCQRWFCVQTPHSEAIRWHCPGCGAEAERLENRAHPAYTSAHRPERAVAPAGRPLPECWHG